MNTCLLPSFCWWATTPDTSSLCVNHDVNVINNMVADVAGLEIREECAVRNALRENLTAVPFCGLTHNNMRATTVRFLKNGREGNIPLNAPVLFTPDDGTVQFQAVDAPNIYLFLFTEFD